MSYEGYIARRYMRSGKAFLSVSTWITILGVTLGVAVVCFVMSMHNGFESEIRSRLLGTTSHISIFPLRESFIENYDELVAQAETIDGVVAASPFIYYKAAISSASEGDGIIIRGIDLDSEARTASIKDDIKIGDYSFEELDIGDDTIPGMLIGSTLADRLRVFIGEPVVLYSLRGEDLQRSSRPRVAKFYISGIFETGLHDYDGQMAYISLDAAQKLFRTGDAVTTVHLKLDDIYRSNELAPIVDSVLGYKFDVVPWTVLHKQIFSWIELEKQVLFLGFILIVLVAGFSIVSTLVMLTMEKRAEIGILKTIGSTPMAVRKIFVYNGFIIGLGGVVAGWLLALAAAWAQNRYQLVSLPPDIYFIKYLPIEVHVTDFLFSGLVTIGICLLAALYPAYRASRLSVVEILRR